MMRVDPKIVSSFDGNWVIATDRDTVKNRGRPRQKSSNWNGLAEGSDQSWKTLQRRERSADPILSASRPEVVARGRDPSGSGPGTVHCLSNQPEVTSKHGGDARGTNKVPSQLARKAQSTLALNHVTSNVGGVAHVTSNSGVGHVTRNDGVVMRASTSSTGSSLSGDGGTRQQGIYTKNRPTSRGSKLIEPYQSRDADRSGAVKGFANPSVIRKVAISRRHQRGLGFTMLQITEPLYNKLEKFTPTPTVPALQYVGEVIKGGCAEQVGLLPGDFILEINGCDASCGQHQVVVKMIRESTSPTLEMKVVSAARTVYDSILAGRAAALTNNIPPKQITSNTAGYPITPPTNQSNAHARISPTNQQQPVLNKPNTGSHSLANGRGSLLNQQPIVIDKTSNNIKHPANGNVEQNLTPSTSAASAHNFGEPRSNSVSENNNKTEDDDSLIPPIARDSMQDGGPPAVSAVKMRREQRSTEADIDRKKQIRMKSRGLQYISGSGIPGSERDDYDVANFTRFSACLSGLIGGSSSESNDSSIQGNAEDKRLSEIRNIDNPSHFSSGNKGLSVLKNGNFDYGRQSSNDTTSSTGTDSSADLGLPGLPGLPGPLGLPGLPGSRESTTVTTNNGRGAAVADSVKAASAPSATLSPASVSATTNALSASSATINTALGSSATVVKENSSTSASINGRNVDASRRTAVQNGSSEQFVNTGKFLDLKRSVQPSNLSLPSKGRETESAALSKKSVLKTVSLDTGRPAVMAGSAAVLTKGSFTTTNSSVYMGNSVVKPPDKLSSTGTKFQISNGVESVDKPDSSTMLKTSNGAKADPRCNSERNVQTSNDIKPGDSHGKTDAKAEASNTGTNMKQIGLYNGSAGNTAVNKTTSNSTIKYTAVNYCTPNMNGFVKGGVTEKVGGGSNANVNEKTSAASLTVTGNASAKAAMVNASATPSIGNRIAATASNASNVTATATDCSSKTAGANRHEIVVTNSNCNGLKLNNYGNGHAENGGNLSRAINARGDSNATAANGNVSASSVSSSARTKQPFGFNSSSAGGINLKSNGSNNVATVNANRIATVKPISYSNGSDGSEVKSNSFSSNTSKSSDDICNKSCSVGTVVSNESGASGEENVGGQGGLDFLALAERARAQYLKTKSNSSST